MRILTSFDKENFAHRFSAFLLSEGIENTIDIEIESEKQKFLYQIWIHDEDKLEKAQTLLDEFIKDPKSSKYDVKVEKEEVNNEVDGAVDEETIKIPGYPYKITAFILGLCVFVYFLNLYQELSIRKNSPKTTYVLLTPVQKYLLFDVPYVLIKVDEVINKYKIDPTKDIAKQSIQAEEELEKIDEMPFWRGIYESILLKKENKDSSSLFQGTLFEQIRKGQVWRLFSPCILHKDLLHIVFNMLWLWLLGKQIENRLSKFKYLLLILLVGITSNLAQYLMSGPYFLGYSGVIMGMVGFIWSRQRVAPWEGYPLQKSVFLFLAVYVLLMFILSFFSFVTQIVGLNLFTPNIANTAHIVGAISGWLLGKLPFFAWSPHHER